MSEEIKTNYYYFFYFLWFLYLSSTLFDFSLIGIHVCHICVETLFDPQVLFLWSFILQITQPTDGLRVVEHVDRSGELNGAKHKDGLPLFGRAVRRSGYTWRTGPGPHSLVQLVLFSRSHLSHLTSDYNNTGGDNPVTEDNPVFKFLWSERS